MNRTIGVLLPLLVLTISPPRSAAAQAPIDAATRAELMTAREAVWRAYYQADTVALIRLLPERMTAMGQDRAQIIRDAVNWSGQGSRYIGMEFSGDRIFVNGNTAIIWSHFVAHLTDKSGKPIDTKGNAIELFVREKGHWINPHWHIDNDK